MDNISSNSYDEISLRELIEVTLNGWKLIAIITVICLLISGVFSYFIIDPTYEAKTTLMASTTTDKLSNVDLNSENIQNILNSISSYPSMTLQTYKEQVKNPSILKETIKELGLEDRGITLNGLAKMISIETIKDTNLIQIKVKNSDSQLSADISNTISKKFTSFITDMARRQASKSSNYVEGQMKVEKEKLDTALLELKEFLSKPKGVQELESELELKLSELNEYKDKVSKEEVSFKDRLLAKDMKEKEIIASLNQAKKNLDVTPEKFITKKSLASDSLMSDVVKEETGSGTSDIGHLEMKEEEINPTYIALKEKISGYEIELALVRQEKANIEYSYDKTREILLEKIDTLNKDLESLNVELADREHEKTLIDRKVNLAQNTYDSFMQKYESIRIAESTEVGESSITIVSQAIVPQSPVGPNKMLNMAIAGVLGIMIGVFMVFFIHYWKTSGEEKKAIGA